MRSRRHALGQNFLHHRPTIQKIIDLAIEHIPPQTKTLIEIGPGKMALTKDLHKIAAEKNLPLHLVERDKYLEEEIRAEIPDAQFHLMDAASEQMEALLDELHDQKLTPAFVVSNLPYSASSQILVRLCHRSHLLSGAVVMVQKEFSQRMVAAADENHRGSFSIVMQSYFSFKHAFDVGPGAFTPPPKIMSSVLILKPLDQPLVAGITNPQNFERFCQKLFSQRRKMIRNLIPAEHHQHFSNLGISGTERPEVLEIKTLIELFRLQN